MESKVLRTVNCSNLEKHNLNYLWMASHMKNQDMLSKNIIGHTKSEKKELYHFKARSISELIGPSNHRHINSNKASEHNHEQGWIGSPNFGWIFGKKVIK
jgi:hypothetical protein